ncbi:CHAT domain-containing tetratricopeptide repeat protein [Flammeovirgaceae bacterium SG7u.111]|nr:CHAT domain-containing tetratricopeptide repeat protein [Flammeovirgaceae bacterium SG7u.132]WPO35672.1 CHAT domain-containing tetratricopeptide repeat protein [Flammeovirgaceae bacterium SG7u.111]
MRFILLASFLLFNVSLHAQNWDRSLEICERYYEEGEYKKALENCDKLIDQLNKRKKGLVVAMVNMHKAKYLEAIGEYGEFEDILLKTLKKKKYKGELSTLYGKANLDAAYLYLLYSDINTAESYLETSRHIFQGSSSKGNDKDGNSQDLYFKSQYLFVETNIAFAKGDFDKARENIPELLKIKNQRLVNRETYFNEVSNRFEQRKLDWFKIRRRKREYAEVLTLKAEIERGAGNYKEAEKYLLEAENWIKDNLNKKDIAWAQCQHAYHLLMRDRGDDPAEVQKLLEKNLFLAERRVGLVHKTFLAIQETLIDSYIDNYSGKSRVQQWELRTNTTKYFGKEKTQHAISERLDAKKKFYQRNYEGALEDLHTLYRTEGKVPLNHKERISLLKQLYDISLANENYEEGLNYMFELLKTEERIYGKSSLKYHYSLMQLADYYMNFSNNFEKVDTMMQESFDGMIAKRISEDHVDYTRFLNQYKDLYKITGNYDSAWHIANEVLKIKERKFGKKGLGYAVGLEGMIDMDLRLGHYQSADSNITNMLDIYQERFNKKAHAYEYSKALETSARYYALMGLFTEAEAALSKANRLYNRSINARANSSAVDELAYLYIQTERFKQTESMLLEAILSRNNRYGEESRFLITPYNQLARLRFLQGDYIQADKLVNKALAIAKNTFGENSYQTVESITIRADIDAAIGDFETANENYTQSILILKDLFGENHIELSNAYTKLALNKFAQGDSLENVERIMKQSTEIISQNLGEDNPVYALSLQNLSKIYTENGNPAEALTLLHKANAIWVNRLGTEINSNSAEISLLMGEAELKRRNKTQAISYFQKGQKTYSKIFNKTHPSYVKATSKLGKAYYADGDWKKSRKYTTEVFGNYLNYIDEFFPALSEREKARYWNTIRGDFEFYNNLAFTNAKKKKKLIGEVYDNTLSTKALLLSNSIKIRRQIQQSGDEAVQELYEKWVEQKELLTKVLAMSSARQKELDIEPKKLEKEIEDIEKELSEKSSVFASGQSVSRQSWKEIKKSLGKNEAAVEIVRYRHFDTEFKDSVVYAAMIITPKSRNPELVVLPNGNLLESNYLRYYRACIIYNIQDENSFANYWEPIDQKLPEGTKVYLSTEGVYNQINLEAMRQKNGNFVIDNRDIVLVSNTKDIIKHKKTEEKELSKNALLIGNPIFYKDLAEEDYNIYNDRKIPQLPGTQKEVVALEKLLNSNAQVSPSLYLNLEATEELVKATESPRIFHIATHGFFLPDETKSVEKEAILSQNKIVSNPLLRSGLLLKNAGDLMDDGNVYSFNREGGVLTAYEAMNLDLDGTELVVLSACETGRGDVKVGEGVYGLQRAFLVAGSDAIIMSLFKVSDEATESLMLLFYENWLNKQMDKRKAFIEAKKSLRDKYQDPIFWAAFIMIGSS